MANNNLPETYGPKCGGKTPQEDSFNCQQQANQQQSSMNKAGGSSCKVIAPQAKGGVEVNSPQNNAQNAGQLHGALNQASSYSKYDNSVGSRNVDNSAGAGGGRKRKRKTKKRKSQKLRRRKVFVGCNRKSRKRLGGKTKKTASWGCMSGGKRKTKKRVTKKGGSFLSAITDRLSGKKKDDNNNEERTAIIERPKLFNKHEETILNTEGNKGHESREIYYGPTDDHSDERPGTIKRPSKLTTGEEKEFEKKKPNKNVSIDESKNKHYGGKRKTRKFKKHYMWNTKGKRYMAKTYKQHLRGKKLGHTHTKPKRKTRKTKKRKTRRTRRRGGDMTPGSPKWEEELKRRKRDRAQGLNIQEEANKRLEAVREKANERKESQNIMMKTMAGMEAEAAAKNKTRQSLPNMSTTSDNSSPDVRSRSNTSRF